MKYPSVAGESQLNGKDGFIELTSFSWGISRSTAAAKAGGSGDADCRVEDAEISRSMDSCSAALLKESLLGKFDRKVEIQFCRTGTNKMLVYASYEFEKCGISAYSTNAAGDVPTERLRLNFGKVTFKAFKVGDDLSAVPEIAFYDLTTGKGG